jgi:hypothetical protein
MTVFRSTTEVGLLVSGINLRSRVTVVVGLVVTETVKALTLVASSYGGVAP